MTNLLNSTVGQIVANDYRACTVFEKHNIDFCCQGNRSLTEACSKADVRPEEILEEIKNLPQEAKGAMPDFNTWPLDLLVDYIEKKHHRYVKSSIPMALTNLAKIVQVHGESHPELYEIEKLFKASTVDLLDHMHREEMILFPYIQKLAASETDSVKILQPQFTTVVNPIEMMMHDHDQEGERFRRISELSDRYTPPKDGCTTYNATYAAMKAFEEDLHRHIHLENNILFPKAIELEKKLSLVA